MDLCRHHSLIIKILVPAIILLCSVFLIAGPASAQQPSSYYQDLQHNSKVFGHEKYYRLYLPEGYARSEECFPVIYFFHGWGGRHYMDENAKLEYEKLKALVDKYRVIMVMWDGRIEENEPRPYNTGNHEDVKYQVQMKDYFPELVSYIDSTYRTLTDRGHRAIIGFSMGGFMSFFLAGKYPDKIIAAVNLAGSPEFFVGAPDNHTLYPLRYTFKNLKEVNTRQHSGDSDILTYMNEEVRKGGVWEDAPYEFYSFHGGHMVDLPGETVAFEMAMKFIDGSFRKKIKTSGNWSHYDLYSDFDVWGYQVKSDKKSPGFIFLKNVSKGGFGLYTHRWLPDGPPVDKSSIYVTTSTEYLPNSSYQVAQYKAATGKVSVFKQKSDAAGRMNFKLDESGNQLGVFTKTDVPEYVFLDYTLGNNKRHLKTASPNRMAIRLFNRGGEFGLPQTIRIGVRAMDSTVKIIDTIVSLSAASGKRILDLPVINVLCNKPAPEHAEPPAVKFKLTIYAAKDTIVDELEVPVYFDAPDFGNIKFDDGVIVKDSVWGTGNADGIPDAGEKLMIYTGENRLRIYTEDPWVLRDRERLKDEIIPEIWPDGFTLTSIIQVSPDCPDGHVIECLASYETKTYNPIERRVHWGKMKMTVRHK